LATWLLGYLATWLLGYLPTCLLAMLDPRAETGDPVGRKPKPLSKLTKQLPANLEIRLSSGVRFQKDKQPTEVAASPTVTPSYFRKIKTNAAHFAAIVSPDRAYRYYLAEVLLSFTLRTGDSLDEVCCCRCTWPFVVANAASLIW
jgi:hypothetical protein